MEETKTEYKTINEYIAAFPEDIQKFLNVMYEAIKESAPDAKEKISYQMPAFDQNGILVYFAAQKKHIGFYPTASGVIAFENELSEYNYSKGTIQFPYDKPLPLDLIQRIVKFRINENLNKKAKKLKR